MCSPPTAHNCSPAHLHGHKHQVVGFPKAQRNGFASQDYGTTEEEAHVILISNRSSINLNAYKSITN